jgi:hypothetical protein
MKYFDGGYGIWIYLLIFVIGSIISATKKKAEAAKQKPVQHTEEEPEAGDPWKELFEKALEEHNKNIESPREVYEEKKEVPVEVKTPAFKPKLTQPTLQPVVTTDSDFIKNSEISNIHDQELVEIQFNLKDAVIYSEILNRKYF